MYRVHGNKIIRRRKEYKKQTDIQKYSEILKEDFGNMCGYCGKNFKFIKSPYQKDHLIPKEMAQKVGREDLITDYNNLVYSCRVCNRNKWDTWPFDDVDKLHDDKVGFVDPASDEYDENLQRDDNGSIVAKTDVGEYMCQIFNFHNRLTEVWWKISVIADEMEEIDKKLDEDETIEGLREYRKLRKQFNELTEKLQGNKECI